MSSFGGSVTASRGGRGKMRAGSSLPATTEGESESDMSATTGAGAGAAHVDPSVPLQPAASGLALWSMEASPFCPTCGSLLVLPDSGDVKCDVCPFSIAMEALDKPTTRTQSYPKPTPEWLVEWQVLQAAQRGEVGDIQAAVLAAGGNAPAKRATVSEECPKCKNPTMQYWTMQLRSADEGQTVFYACPACDHTFSLNT